MKTCAAVIVFWFAAWPSQAASVDAPPDDSEKWWGNTGALPGPQQDQAAAGCDDLARTGFWWWPKAPAAGDRGAMWGNRGVVFHRWLKEDRPATAAATPPPPPPATIICYRHVLNDMLFDLNKAVLRPGDIPNVDDVVAVLRQDPEFIVAIEGHACDLGTPEYNMALGLRRAETVKRYLVEHGIDAARISTRSLGDTKPAFPNDSDINRQLNRYVSFELSFRR